MLNTAQAYIDLSALANNLATVRSLCPNSKVMAVIKANAYGHGLLETATAMRSADGLATARIQEALQLRHAGINQRLLLLGTLLSADEVSLCAEHSIDIVVHNASSLERVCRHKGKKLNVWIKLDTGMHRLGLNQNEYAPALAVLEACGNTDEIIQMSHFSGSEHTVKPDVTLAQIDVFEKLTNYYSYPSSLANSGAIINWPQSHRDWVRPGIMLYGANPEGDSLNSKLKPVMTLTSRLLNIREIQSGECVGYGGIWQSKKNTRIGTVGVGYGDGYPRHAQNGTPVLIRGHLVPLIGRVSMDLITVDLGDLAAEVGDEVTLWGRGLNLETVARHANTISYQLLTAVSERVERTYKPIT